MTLPEIVLPKIEIPFEIPLLMHPPIVHFIIAIPVIVLILELFNLMMKKKAVGGVSFLLLVLTVVAAIGAYFTGLTDGGKEVYELLDKAAKSDLSQHKLLGTYVLLGSAVVLFFKLLAMTGSKLLKALYIIILMVFLILLFKQGEEGGELVYEHGLNVNVKKVKALDDKVVNLNDALEDAEKKTSVTPIVKPIENIQTEVTKPTVVETVTKAVETVSAPVTEAVITPTVVETVPTTSVQTVSDTVNNGIAEVKSVATDAVETIVTP